MARVLNVYLHRDLAGTLTQDDHGESSFTYDPSWLDRPDAISLSHSLPLQREAFSRRQCRGFFAGLLPEESNRELVARNLGISATNDFSMLEKIGGECAGAVTFLPPDVPLPMGENHYRKLSAAKLAHILRELPRRPMLAGDQDIRLSLAGAQDKLPVYVDDGNISIPLDSAPSSHILKPGSEHFDGLIYNEAFCLALAAAVGLRVVKAELRQADGRAYLLVERYDRKRESSGSRDVLRRVHQEDFCQALGVPPEHKYQSEEGPSLQQCFALLREVSTTPVIDIQRFLEGVIFNFLIGNHDAHGKNFSLLYDGGGVRLAPLYDLVCTVFYPDLTKKMAMKIGGEYESAKIIDQNFERMAEEAGLAKPMVRKRVPEMARAILDKTGSVLSAHPKASAVAALIRERCEGYLI